MTCYRDEGSQHLGDAVFVAAVAVAFVASCYRASSYAAVVVEVSFAAVAVGAVEEVVVG